MKRQKTNNALFLRLCREGKEDAEILKRMSWKVRTAKSKKDPTKRVRAYRWTAIHKGLVVNGKRVFLKVGEESGAKTGAKQAAEPAEATA